MKPPGWMEWTVARLLPKDRRETVLGDLEERYTSPLGYCADAFTSVPAAILGQIRREMPLPFRLLEALLVFVGVWLAFAFGAAEDAAPSFQKSSSAVAVVMAGLLFRDVYFPFSTKATKEQEKLAALWRLCPRWKGRFWYFQFAWSLSMTILWSQLVAGLSQVAMIQLGLWRPPYPGPAFPYFTTAWTVGPLVLALRFWLTRHDHGTRPWQL